MMTMHNTYEFRTAEGRVCCSTENVEHLCDTCKATLATLTTTPPPDPYAAGLAILRASSSSAAFEMAYKQERTRQLKATRAALDEKPR